MAPIRCISLITDNMQFIFHFDRFLHSICNPGFIVIVWLIYFSIWKTPIVFLRYNSMKFTVRCLCIRYVSDTVPIDLLHFICEFLNILPSHITDQSCLSQVLKIIMAYITWHMEYGIMIRNICAQYSLFML